MQRFRAHRWTGTWLAILAMLWLSLAPTLSHAFQGASAALWTEVCLAFPAIEATRDGYDVYFVTDSSGGTSVAAHEQAIQRMIQAGATPLTWIQLALEWQRDWARKEHYDEVLAIMKEHGGAYGQGIEYAYTMVHGAPASRGKGA